mmetsp:Transcript_36503/g.107821  ORF Transcript_36503/g.107821 Transcript_36503/m.107821 type:complete len:230 (+) Transcript_36503:512-1201(+)
MYVGSMYLMSASPLKNFLNSLRSTMPMSVSTGLPDASVSVTASDCPAPSATHTTQWPCCWKTLLTNWHSFSMLNGISGMRHTSTTPLAMDACMAMKPDWRPMSFTKPRPWYALLASTFAASSARCASSTAVSNPKQRSTRRMSLSMDFGTPMTAHVTPCASHSCAIACAAALPPLPPITNTMLRPHKSIRFTISVMLAPPREVPSMVPPLRWIPLTSLVVRVMGLSERS